MRRRRARPPGHARSPARCAPPGAHVDGPLGRGAGRRRRRRRAPVRPRRRDRRRGRRVAAGPLVGHCSGATASTPLGRHEAFCAASADDGARATGAELRGRRLRGRGHDAARAGRRARRSRERARACAPSRSPTTTAPPTTPPRRSPRTSSSRSRPPPSAWPPPPASTARALVPLVRATVENWARARRRARAHRARSPAATRRPSPASARRVAERAPELLELFDALADARPRDAGRARRSPA